MNMNPLGRAIPINVQEVVVNCMMGKKLTTPRDIVYDILRIQRIMHMLDTQGPVYNWHYHNGVH